MTNRLSEADREVILGTCHQEILSEQDKNLKVTPHRNDTPALFGDYDDVEAGRGGGPRTAQGRERYQEAVAQSVFDGGTFPIILANPYLEFKSLEEQTHTSFDGYDQLEDFKSLSNL